jgi:prepilin-type N-terminal cleavage/methylation domain-containing protein
MRKKGFTMIELVIVIAVLAILVALAAIMYKGITDSAKDASVKADIKAIEDGQDYAEAKSDTLIDVNNEDTTTTTMSDLYGIVDVASLTRAGKHFYKILNQSNTYIKRTHGGIGDYLIDESSNVYYKGVVSNQTVKKWDKTYSFTGYCVINTSDGNYIMAGNKNDDLWIIKINSNGKTTWEKTYDGGFNQFDTAKSIIQTSDGGFIVTGQTYETSDVLSGNVWLMKLDSNGNKSWDKTFNGEGNTCDNGRSVIQTSDGGYAICGETDMTFTPSTKSKMWVIKTDSLGNEIWNKAFVDGVAGVDFGRSIIQNSDGSLIAAGRCAVNNTRVNFDAWVIKLDINGNEIWKKTYDGGPHYDDYCESIVLADDGGYVLAGRTTKSSGSYSGDMWLVKIDNSGTELWNKNYDGTSNYNDYAFAVKKTKEGGYILAGYTNFYTSNATARVWIYKTDANGDYVWDRALPYIASGVYTSWGICQTNDNGYIVLLGTTAWLIKMDAVGNYQ